MFWGLKFSIPGFFLGGRNWQIFFCVCGFDLSRDFFWQFPGGSGHIFQPRSSAKKVQSLLQNFKVRRFTHGIFLGLIFGPGIFWGSVGSPRDF